MAGSLIPEKTERNRELFLDYCRFKLGEMSMVELITKYQITDTRIEQIARSYAKKNNIPIPDNKENQN